MNACGKREIFTGKAAALLEGPVSSSSHLLLLLNYIPNPGKEHVYKIARSRSVMEIDFTCSVECFKTMEPPKEKEKNLLIT